MSVVRRFFVGAQPPPQARERVALHVGRRLDPRVWRLVAAADLHLTIAFLGDLEDDSLPPLRAALRTGLAGQAAIDVVLEGAGTFERDGRPHVAWIGIGAEREAMARLEALARTSYAAAVPTRALAAERSDPSFAPHVTVARPRPGAVIDVLPSTLGPAERWTIDAVHLFESRSGAQPRYVPLERFPLRA